MESEVLNEEIYHKFYDEEKLMIELICSGNIEKVQTHLEEMLKSVELLPCQNEKHYRYLVIMMIAIIIREAMARGVSPVEAYRKSDVFLNRVETCNGIEELLVLLHDVVVEFTGVMVELYDEKKISVYTEQCMRYIHKNYCNKIYIKEVAAAVGVSKGYLVKVFHHDTGMGIQEYIQKARVERAANLLKYSEASLLEISEYAHFSSQSHFGLLFRKHMGITPGQYRERYKPKEFITGKSDN